jgi:hypothetical protein
MTADQKTTKKRHYDTAIKNSAAGHWMLSGKPARTITVEPGIHEQNPLWWPQRR